MNYCGIGSRSCPNEFLDYFTLAGSFLAIEGLTLRSGGANGCDKAFEDGCNAVGGKKEIYLPWNGFNGSKSNLVVKDQRAFDIAKKYHPYWYNLKDGAKKLQARNSHQVLGWDLKSPTNFILCWTKNGEMVGGTSQALRIAEDYNIPIFNFGKYKIVEDSYKPFKEFLEMFIKIN